MPDLLPARLVNEAFLTSSRQERLTFFKTLITHSNYAPHSSAQFSDPACVPF